MLKPMQSACATLRIGIVVVIGLSVSSWNRAERVSAQATEPIKARAGACEGEAEKLLGQKPVRISGSIRPPKRVRDASPDFRELPPGTTVSGMWIGEALVDNSGQVTRVWPVREVVLRPASPAFNNAIVDAIRRWEYEPLLVDSKPSPFCMTVSVNIDF